MLEMEILDRQGGASLGGMGLMSEPHPQRMTDDYKFNFRTTQEVGELWEMMIARIRTDPSIRYGDKRPTRQSIVNAIILWLGSRSDAEQKEIIREGMAAVNSRLGGSGEREAKHSPAKQAKPPGAKDDRKSPRGGKAG